MVIGHANHSRVRDHGSNGTQGHRRHRGAPRAPYHSITVNRLTPIIGAEVSGVDLSQPPGEEQLKEIRRAFLENHVLVFRDQHLTVEQHKAFGRLFGPLRALPVESIDGDDPELVVVRANAQSRFAAGELWHTDGTADLEPSMGSMLYVKETPPSAPAATHCLPTCTWLLKCSRRRCSSFSAG